MPITYEVHNDGHFIYAVAHGAITSNEFVDYEIAHAIDLRIQPPVVELFVIEHGACKDITKEDVARVFLRRSETEPPPTRHRCAIIVSYSDRHGWDLAKFYEGMVALHCPESVIVFGDELTGRAWLGIDGPRSTTEGREGV